MASQPRTDNIIAIASGKGGVGKTWFSITLAHLLARGSRQTLLFDGDIGLANIDVQLGLTPQRDLGAVFAGQCKLTEAIAPFTTQNNLHIVAGRSGSTSLASLGLTKMQPVGEQLIALASQYDFILLDLGAGIEQHVQYLSSLASRIIVVVTDEPTSLTDAYAFIKLCVTRDNPPEIHMVVNQAASQKEGEKTFSTIERACENFLKFKPACLGVIRKDNKVRDAIRQQTSIITTAPHTTAATDVAAISIKLLR